MLTLGIVLLLGGLLMWAIVAGGTRKDGDD